MTATSPRPARSPRTARSAALTPVGIGDVALADGFLKQRCDTNRAVTLPLQYRLQAESGALDGYQWEWWDPAKGLPPFRFWCGDVAKWIEAASYSLRTHPDAELAARVDDAITRIVRGQKSDGYLYSNPLPEAARFGNLGEYHELYDVGHLIEAAVAHRAATGSTRLLDAICRAADLLCERFGDGPGRIRGTDGHPEIELALVKLHRATGQERYLALAKFLIDVRGTEPNRFAQEAPHIAAKGLRRFGWYDAAANMGGYGACQAHEPLRRQRHAVGHAVRALYLYSGAADVAAATGDKELRAACRRLWDSVAQRRMYVTGGVGSAWHGERFTCDHDLPNETAYAETCASVALVFFAQRMLNLEADSRYADVMERALYNGVLSGISLGGDRFFYSNRLTIFPRRPNGLPEPVNDHVAPTRQRWFGCACCPPNVARLLASLGQYLYATRADELYVHLYAAGELTVELAGRRVTLTQRTRYPWDGAVRIALDLAEPSRFALLLRIPGWCRGARLRVDGKAVAHEVVRGYARVDRTWRRGDVVELTMPMPVEKIEAHPHVRMDCGKVALQRGPVVYCLEEVDNGPHLADITIPAAARFTTASDAKLGAATVLHGHGWRRDVARWRDALYRPRVAARRKVRVKAVPYCLWNNRGDGEMAVWVTAR